MPTTANRGYITPVTTDEATIPADMKLLADGIDADVQQLDDRMAAQENTFVIHSGDGTWEVANGLGDPVPVSDLGDGTYQIGA